MHLNEELFLHSADGLSHTSINHLLLRQSSDILLRQLIAHHTVSTFNDLDFDAARDTLNNELVSFIKSQGIGVNEVKWQRNEGICFS